MGESASSTNVIAFLARKPAASQPEYSRNLPRGRLPRLKRLERRLITLIVPIMRQHGLALPDVYIPAGHPICAAVETAMARAGLFNGGVKVMKGAYDGLGTRINDRDRHGVETEALWLAWNAFEERMLRTPIADAADAMAVLDLLEYCSNDFADWPGIAQGIAQLRAYIARQERP